MGDYIVANLHIVMILMLQLDKYYNIIISFFMGINFSVFLTFWVVKNKSAFHCKSLEQIHQKLNEKSYKEWRKVDTDRKQASEHAAKTQSQNLQKVGW